MHVLVGRMLLFLQERLRLPVHVSLVFLLSFSFWLALACHIHVIILAAFAFLPHFFLEVLGLYDLVIHFLGLLEDFYLSLDY